MADTVDPNTTGQSTRSRSASAGRLTFAVGVEDLGTASFTVLFVLCGLIILTPLGTLMPVVVLVGLGTIALGAQLVMRRPHVQLPDKARSFILENTILQTVLKRGFRYKEQLEADAASTRRPAHWLTTEPFDLVPRMLLIICGVLTVFSATTPEMARVLGVAVIALAISLHVRTPYWALSGASLMSLASILPLFSS